MDNKYNCLVFPETDLIILKSFINYCFTTAEAKQLLEKKVPKIPGTNVKLPQNFIKFLREYLTPKKAQMPKHIADLYRRNAEEYFNDLRYHQAVNSLSERTQESIKLYTQDPGYKYVADTYKIIAKGIEEMPKSTTEIVLFRGQDRENLNSEKWFSASTEQKVAIEHFTAPNCCLIVLFIEPGVKMLPVYEFNKNFFNWENEVIVQGGGYLQFIDQDMTGEMPTFTYRYRMTPFADIEEKKPQKPLSEKQAVKLEKDLDKLANMINREEILQDLEMFDMENTRENRIQLVKDWLEPLHKQFELPFSLDDRDYEEIHDIAFEQMSETT